MNDKLPGILVTGASGFIGRHFVIAGAEKFRLFCIARRSQKEVGILRKDTIHWLQADITRWDNLLRVFKYIKNNGGVDYVVHLAGYYDFTLKENPAYEQVNVIGTRHLLDLSKMLAVKRFIFSSSVAACKFPPKGKLITEASPPDEDFPYACSKRRAELLIKEYSESFPSSIVRLAAVYSDWCEYPMLYMLLRSWLSKKNLFSRIVAGHGESAIPYIHIRDLVKLLLQILEISDTLPQFATYIASPQGSVSHHELFKTATRYYFGREITPFRISKIFARLGLCILSLSRWLIDKDSLEKPWMAKYIDKKLDVDASETYNALNWKPTPRYHILRRLLFITEKMISQSTDWKYRNEMLLQHPAYRKSTTIYNILAELREPIVKKIIEEVMIPANSTRFFRYQKMDRELLKWYITLNYQLVASAVRRRDRSMIPGYAQEIAYRRFIEGFETNEVKDLMFLTGQTMKESLLARPELKGLKQRVDDYIVLTSQFAADEFEDAYERFEDQPLEKLAPLEDIGRLAKPEIIKIIVGQLEDISDTPFQNRRKINITFKKNFI